MDCSELKTKIIFDLKDLAQQAHKKGKSSKKLPESEQLMEISVLLQTMSKAILQNNYQKLMMSKEVIDIQRK